MLDILLNNYLLIINILIPFAIGLFLFFTHRKYSLKEFVIQISITTFILILMFFIGYRVSDVYTKSYKSTEVQKFIFEEEWTERVTYTESYSCGKSTCYITKTRYDHHPDRYYIVSKFSDESISEKMYLKAANKFGSTKIRNSQPNQSSFGNGRTYAVVPTEKIVHSDYDSEVNYIYASKTNIIKSNEFKDLEEQFKAELNPYSSLYSDLTQYGNTNFDRLFNKHLINENLANKIQAELEQLSINFPGNPMIYLTSSTNRNFAYVLKGYYKDAYFYDAMIVVGVDSTDSNKILWTEALSISDSAEFKVYSTNLTESFDELIPKFSEVLKTYWKKPNLEDYKYMANSIDLPLWYEFLIVILNIICSALAFRYMLKNEL